MYVDSNLLDKKRDPNTPNLCYMVYIHLVSLLGETAANIFKNDPTIQEEWEHKPPYQIVIMNRYFNNLLLRFRAKVNIPVHDTTVMLLKDGTVDDWFWAFTKFVGLFLKENNVFNVVYGNNLKLTDN